MGYEGDPMRLLFEGGLAPTHIFSAYYRWLREDYVADAVLHFGTHGALEFMPGKQVGLSDKCWPDRLIADLPNFYLYAANNPSEGLIAKRRSAATLISYLTPPVTRADLHKQFAELRSMIDRWRTRDPRAHDTQLMPLLEAISAQAERCELSHSATPERIVDAEPWVGELRTQLDEIETALIPFCMHVVGAPMSSDERAETMSAIAEAGGAKEVDPLRLDTYAKGNGAKCAVSGGVTVATNHGHARLGNAKFWTNNVYDSLIGMPQSKEVNAVFFAVFGKLAYLLARQGILDG